MKEFNLEERVAQARQNFLDGYTCSQSVLLAYADVIGLDPTLAATIAAPFGGGMGRLREVCGAVSGMFMLAGFIEPYTDTTDKAAKMRNYALVQDMAAEFRKVNGAIVCRELLHLAQKSDPPTPADRTPEYYKKRPCTELIATAARIVGIKLQTLLLNKA